MKQYTILYTNKILNNSTVNMIEKHHYSKTARSLLQQHCFELLNTDTGEIVGAAVYGIPCGSKVRKKYGKKCVELRRLVITERVMNNITSWFLSRTLKYLKNHTFVSGVITYADPNVGHTGTIYKACNFKYLGKEIGNNPRIFRFKRKKLHLRQIYQKRDGKYQKSSLLYQKLIKQGVIRIIKQKPKERFFYKL